MHPLLVRLTTPGQKYSTNAVVLLKEVGDNQEKFDVFLEAVLHPDTSAGTTRYAVDLAEKISRRYPQLLLKHETTLIKALPTIQRPVIRWHLALLLSYLPLHEGNLATAVSYLQTWLQTDTNKFTKVHCLQALADLSRQYNWLKSETILLIEQEMASGAAVIARGKKLLRELKAN